MGKETEVIKKLKVEESSYMNNNQYGKVAICFSGGGGKGAYEIGVWKALNEFGITENVTGISGTSVGALNAALFAQGDYQCAYNTWCTISQDAVCTFNDAMVESGIRAYVEKMTEETIFEDTTKSMFEYITNKTDNEGVLKKKGLSALIEDNVEYEEVMKFPGAIYISAYNKKNRYTRYFELHRDTSNFDDMQKLLLASACIPFVFGDVKIDGESYWDGGIEKTNLLPKVSAANTPVDILYKDNFSIIIVVHCSREIAIDKSKYPNAIILEIMPQKDMGGVIKGTMNFDPYQVQINIDRGYNDAKRILQPIYEMHKSNKEYLAALFFILEENESFEIQHKKIMETNKYLNKKMSDSIKGLIDSGKI